jgi:glucose-1-phosphate thymidylyltransferase
MNVLILAAGYATRLHPLTLNKAKPLLEVGGKPMIEWVLDNLAPVSGLKTIFVVTNNKFAKDFQDWAKDYMARHPKLKLKIINDGTTSDADKLGAIGDINLVITREDLISDDLLVVAGDNLFSEPLTNFVEDARGTKAMMATYDVGSVEACKKYSNITLDSDGVITDFEEKPAKPQNSLAGIALYYFSRETIPMFTTYTAAGNNPDQPGRFIQWLYKQIPVKTHQIRGTWFDIGSKETLEEANRIFGPGRGD